MRGHPRWIAIAGLALAGCLAGCRGGTGAAGERPAPPGQLTVTGAAGGRFTGPAARVDIRHAGAGAPAVELVMSATDGTGRTWALQAALPAEALESLVLHARLVQRPLQVGDATVQLAAPGAEPVAAAAGLLQARLRDGQIEGAVTGAAAELDARFRGPFVVTCAAPAAGGGSTLVVDEKLESPACRRHAGLGRRKQ